MDDIAVGLALRRIRLRRNDRQVDVARLAGISQSEYSRIERGHLERAPLRTIRAAAAALEVRIGLTARWRGGDLDRLLHGRHAAMGAALADRLRGAGWEVVPEVSFNHFGERGVIDLLAWHAPAAGLLVIELKTELVDVNELLGSMDRRLRLAGGIGRDRGWASKTVSGWVVLAESRTNRRHLAAFRPLLRAALPEDGRSVPGWIRCPDRRQLAMWFLSDSPPGTHGRGLAPTKRVRRGRPRSDPRRTS